MRRQNDENELLDLREPLTTQPKQKLLQRYPILTILQEIMDDLNLK